ncbi:MAG: AbrB/MazE/SpoVT family DNA-binding domain-containing protein [Elusimicrobia bacterium]|nr:AbrB/MazE/SpoVT family DNA-binding domain-containing protein [Elusimicrobiota bacterium]
METLSSPVGAKFQITLPKRIRAALGIRKAGERVGFRLEGSRVVLAKAEVRFEEEPFTDEEWAKLVAMVRSAPRPAYSARQYRERIRKLAGG